MKEVQASDGEPVLVMSASTRRLVVGVRGLGSQRPPSIMPRLQTIHSQAESRQEHSTGTNTTGHGASGCTRDASEESGAHSPLPVSPLMSMRTLVGGCGAGGGRSPTADGAQTRSVVGPYFHWPRSGRGPPSPTHVAASVGWVPTAGGASAPSLQMCGLSPAGEACGAGASGATAPSAYAGVQSHAQAPSGSMHNHSGSVQSSGPSASGNSGCGVSCGLGSVTDVTAVHDATYFASTTRDSLSGHGDHSASTSVVDCVGLGALPPGGRLLGTGGGALCASTGLTTVSQTHRRLKASWSVPSVETIHEDESLSLVPGQLQCSGTGAGMSEFSQAYLWTPAGENREMAADG